MLRRGGPPSHLSAPHRVEPTHVVPAFAAPVQHDACHAPAAHSQAWTRNRLACRAVDEQSPACAAMPFKATPACRRQAVTRQRSARTDQASPVQACQREGHATTGPALPCNDNKRLDGPAEPRLSVRETLHRATPACRAEPCCSAPIAAIPVQDQRGQTQPCRACRDATRQSSERPASTHSACPSLALPAQDENCVTETCRSMPAVDVPPDAVRGTSGTGHAGPRLPSAAMPGLA